MIRRSDVTLPYTVLQPGHVTCSPADGWRLQFDSTTESIILRDRDLLESWDALASIRLFRSVGVPPNSLECLGLSPHSARLCVVVTVATGRGLLREVVQQVDLPQGCGTVSLEFSPKSDHLLRDLQISTKIVVVEIGEAALPLAPAQKGARVWEDSIRVQLEGGRARLPMEVVSFRDTPAFRPFESALFHVQVSGDSDTEVEQGLLVHLNGDHPTFISRVESGDVIATALLWDGVVREVMREVLAQELVDDGPSMKGTLGELAWRWASQAFQGQSPAAIVRIANERPSEFDAVIASWCGSLLRIFTQPEEH